MLGCIVFDPRFLANQSYAALPAGSLSAPLPLSHPNHPTLHAIITFDLASNSNPELVSSHSVTSSLVHSSLPRRRSSVPSLSLSSRLFSSLNLSRPARPQLLTTRNSSSPRAEYNQPPRLEPTTFDLGSEVRLDRQTQAGFRLSSVLHRKYKSFHPPWFASITRRKDGFGPPRSCRVDNRKRTGKRNRQQSRGS